MNRSPNLRRAALLAAAAVVSWGTWAGEVNIYTERQQVLLEPILDGFREATGHTTNVLYLDKGVIDRLRAEGQASPADVAIVADIGRLQQLDDAGVTQPIDEPGILAQVPAHLRDPDGGWVALSRRLRVAFLPRDSARVPLNFAELALPEWRGQVCLRSGTHPYNVALVAALVLDQGVRTTFAWLGGIKANLARKPQGNDRAQIKGVANGECGVGIANLYYLHKMATSDDPAERAIVGQVRWVAPLIGDGAHANVSGIALAKHAPNREAAVALIRYLVSDAAQADFAALNGELPVRDGIPLTATMREAASVPTASQAVADIARLRETASALVSAAELDN